MLLLRHLRPSKRSSNACDRDIQTTHRPTIAWAPSPGTLIAGCSSGAELLFMYTGDALNDAQCSGPAGPTLGAWESEPEKRGGCERHGFSCKTHCGSSPTTRLA